MSAIAAYPEDTSPEAVSRLTKDLLKATKTLSEQEVRYLVDYYYISQEDRKRAHNQERALNEGQEPCAVIGWLADQSTLLEKQIKRALDAYAKSHLMGDWLYNITGIGPVISAGLFAHIDIAKAPTVGHIWRYAGFDPTVKWEKKQKRPWNASLKTLCWKIGQSFMKFSNSENCFYGKIYRERKELEIANNEAGKYADQAKIGAERVGKSTEAYKHYSAGKLPPGHIDARARRYAVKLFLAHFHAEWYQRHFGEPAPKPYAIAILGHAHEISHSK